MKDFDAKIFRDILNSGKAASYVLPEGLGELEVCPRYTLLEDINACRTHVGWIFDLKYLGEDVLTISDNWDMEDLKALIAEWMPVIRRIYNEKQRVAMEGGS